MTKKGLITLIIIVLLLGAGYYFRSDLADWLQFTQNKLEISLDQLQTIEQEVITPEPLVGPTEQITSNLTVNGVVEQTNIQRQQNDLSALTINAKLTAAAQAKVDDMFAQQYFAHQSPDGKGPGDLAKEAGYQYVMVGENLALGNFADDRELVQAWMDSPGHRENILKERYTEIGVAVKRGLYQGDMVWLAVQEFGRPTPNCLSPDKSLKTQIDDNASLLKNLEQQIKAKKEELENTEPKRGPEYNQKVEEYNNLVNQYNALAEATKKLVSDYNSQVNAYNACINS